MRNLAKRLTNSSLIGLIVIGSLLAFAPISLKAQDTPPARKADLDEGLRLLKEGDELADKGSYNEAVQKYKAGFEQILPGMRKIPFVREVGSDVTEREKLGEFLVKEFDEEIPAEEFKSGEAGMKALGLIPESMNLKEFMVKLLTEEIAAFYDPKTGKMHMIKEVEPPGGKPVEKPSFLERLMGVRKGFDKDENKTVIAHELTHALADQNYDLRRLQKLASGDDDRDKALSSLIEGEATLSMMGAQSQDWDGKVTVMMPADILERTMGFLMPLMPASSGKTMRQAPLVLSEGLVFPYLRGLVFCAHLTNATGDWSPIDKAYKEPPLSTEQIMHPEKYLKMPRDVPQAIDLGDLSKLTGQGWKALGGNVAGEMGVEILLRGLSSKKAAAGWDGDRYETFEGDGGKLALVWMTTWDSEADASEFVDSYTKRQASKIAKLKSADEGDKAPKESEPTNPGHVRRSVAKAVYAIERQGADVAIVEGFEAEATEKLISAALKAKKTEKRHDVPAKPQTKKD